MNKQFKIKPLYDQLWDQPNGQLGDQLYWQLWLQLHDQLRGQLYWQLSWQLINQLVEDIKNSGNS